MQRISLGVSYDGSGYHGWQIQDNLKTVQRDLELALGSVANHPVALTCAGRTDAGVHATGQVVHFDTTSDRSEHAWVFGANTNLPQSIRVNWAHPVSREFHARYSALTRHYRYVLYNNPIRPGILQKAVGWHYAHLDEKSMQIAANYLLGQHDFTTFRGRDCQANHPIRWVKTCRVTRQGSMLIIEVVADAFLLHMVRNIVGSLIEVGTGKREPDWIAKILALCDRRQAGMTATPHGLYLVQVEYPPEFLLPRTSPGPFFLY